MASTTDNQIDLSLLAPRNSYIISKPAADMFPFLKDIASKYRVPESMIGGGMPIQVTEGEVFAPEQMVNDMGLDALEYYNNKPKEGGHQSIDSIIALDTLQRIKPMTHGGEVNIDNYANGGVTTPNGVMGYENGGGIFPEMDIRRSTPNLSPSPYMRYERVEGAPMRGDPLFDDRRALTDMMIGRGENPNWYGSGKSQFTGKPLSIDWKDYVESGQGNTRDEMLLDRLLRSESGSSRIYDKSKADIDNLNFLAKQGYQLDEEETQAPVQKLMDALSGERSLLNNIRRTSSYWTPEGRARREGAYESTGMQTGGLAGYENGGGIYGSNINPEGVFQSIYRAESDLGDRYYLGEAQRPQLSLSRKLATQRAMDKSVSSPQDSVTFDMVQQILNPEPEKRGFIKKLLGMANGGEVPGYENGGQPQQDDAMMQQYLQQQQMQQQQPQQQGQQQPSIAPPGAAAGDTMSWGRFGEHTQAIQAEKDSLDMEDSLMLQKKAQNFFAKLRLDSLSNSGSIERQEPYGTYKQQLSPAQASEARNRSEYMNQQRIQWLLGQAR